MLFCKISVFILKLFLAKIRKKLKAPGTPSSLSRSFANPSACRLLLSGGQTMVLARKVQRNFQCCKADAESTRGKTSLRVRYLQVSPRRVLSEGQLQSSGRFGSTEEHLRMGLELRQGVTRSQNTPPARRVLTVTRHKLCRPMSVVRSLVSLWMARIL